MSMKRDDDFIVSMLQRFINFYRSFVVPNIEPPVNFDQNDKVLIDITKQTKRIAAQAQLVRRISSGHIQRSPSFFRKETNAAKNRIGASFVNVDW